MIKTIRDLENEYGNTFLKTVLEPYNYSFFIPVSLEELDKILKLEKGSLRVITEDKEELEEILEYTMYLNKYKYTKLAESLLLEYNPIENYNMEESENFENTGTGSESRNTSFSNGEQKETIVTGERQNTNVLGERNETYLNGAKTETLKHGAVSETVQHGAVTESVKHGAVTETTVNGAVSENVSTDYGTQTETTAESLGQKQKNTTNVLGGGTDTKDISNSEQVNSSNESIGGKTDTKTDTLGLKNITVENAVNSFDTEVYNNLDKNITREDGVSNTYQNVTGSSQNSSQQTLGATTTQESTITGERTNTTMENESAVENTSTVTKNGYTDTTAKTVAERTDRKNTGEYTDTTSTAEYTDTKNTGEYTDTNTTAEHTDSKTVDSVTDTNTTASSTDTVTKDSFTNTESDSVTKEDSQSGNRALTRKGNIGVTTTQQMIQQERDIAKFSLEQIIIADIVESLCIRLWDV